MTSQKIAGFLGTIVAIIVLAAAFYYVPPGAKSVPAKQAGPAEQQPAATAAPPAAPFLSLPKADVRRAWTASTRTPRLTNCPDQSGRFNSPRSQNRPVMMRNASSVTGSRMCSFGACCEQPG